EHERRRRARPGAEEERAPALERAEQPLRLELRRVRVALVVERPRLAVDVGRDRRPIERRRQALLQLRLPLHTVDSRARPLGCALVTATEEPTQPQDSTQAKLERMLELRR